MSVVPRPRNPGLVRRLGSNSSSVPDSPVPLATSQREGHPSEGDENELGAHEAVVSTE